MADQNGKKRSGEEGRVFLGGTAPQTIHTDTKSLLQKVKGERNYSEIRDFVRRGRRGCRAILDSG